MPERPRLHARAGDEPGDEDERSRAPSERTASPASRPRTSEMRGAGVSISLSKYPRSMSVTVAMPATPAAPATPCRIAIGIWKPM